MITTADLLEGAKTLMPIHLRRSFIFWAGV